MALSKEVITQNIEGLTDDQIVKIVTLSANDESQVIGSKISEIYTGLDQDILQSSGVSKNGVEKTYEYAKRVIGELKKTGASDDLKKQIESLTTEKEKLQQQLKEGKTDEALKGQYDALQQKFTDKDNQLKKLQKQYEDERLEWDGKVKAEQEKNSVYRVEQAFEVARMGKQFKDGIPEEAINATLQLAKKSVLAAGKLDWVTDDTTGKEMPIFRDANGMIITNPNNLQKPFTAGEMYLSKIAPILKEGVNQNGAGTGSNDKGGNATLSISGAKSQVDMNRAIEKHLMDNGIAKSDPKYLEQTQEIQKANNYDSLPLQ